MSPVITIMAVILCAGLVALVRAVLVAPIGSEDENGFVLKAVAKKQPAKSPAAASLLEVAPARAHRRVRAA